MVIDEPNICNQTGRVYFCINGNESSVCHVRLYNTPHSDDGIIALFEEKNTLYLGSDGLVNRLYVIRRYFSKRLVFHSRSTTRKVTTDMTLHMAILPERRKTNETGKNSNNE